MAELGAIGLLLGAGNVVAPRILRGAVATARLHELPVPVRGRIV